MKRFRIPYGFRPFGSESYISVCKFGEISDVTGSHYDEIPNPQHSFTCGDMDIAHHSYSNSDDLDFVAHSFTGDDFSRSRTSRMYTFI